MLQGAVRKAQINLSVRALPMDLLMTACFLYFIICDYPRNYNYFFFPASSIPFPSLYSYLLCRGLKWGQILDWGKPSCWKEEDQGKADGGMDMRWSCKKRGRCNSQENWRILVYIEPTLDTGEMGTEKENEEDRKKKKSNEVEVLHFLHIITGSVGTWCKPFTFFFSKIPMIDDRINDSI